MTTKEEFDRAWTFIEPSVDPKFTLSKIGTSKEEVEQYLLDGKAVIFLGDQSAMLVEIVSVNPEYPMLNAWATGGKLKDLLTTVWPEVETWGRDHGFKKILGMGRRQWGSTIRKLGFEVEAITYSKDL